jgi:hypothetical protein
MYTGKPLMLTPLTLQQYNTIVISMITLRDVFILKGFLFYIEMCCSQIVLIREMYLFNNV